MWCFFVVFPSGDGHELGYAAADHTYISAQGTLLAYWRDDGDVFAAEPNGVQGALVKNIFSSFTGA
jgi:hypothetical protein